MVVHRQHLFILSFTYRQKFTFDVKWYALLNDITLPETEGKKLILIAGVYNDSFSISETIHIGTKEKELSNEIRNLRSKVSSTRDSILKEVIISEM